MYRDLVSSDIHDRDMLLMLMTMKIVSMAGYNEIQAHGDASEKVLMSKQDTGRNGSATMCVDPSTARTVSAASNCRLMSRNRLGVILMNAVKK